MCRPWARLHEPGAPPRLWPTSTMRSMPSALRQLASPARKNSSASSRVRATNCGRPAQAALSGVFKAAGRPGHMVHAFWNAQQALHAKSRWARHADERGSDLAVPAEAVSGPLLPQQVCLVVPRPDLSVHGRRQACSRWGRRCGRRA